MKSFAAGLARLFLTKPESIAKMQIESSKLRKPIFALL